MDSKNYLTAEQIVVDAYASQSISDDNLDQLTVLYGKEGCKKIKEKFEHYILQYNKEVKKFIGSKFSDQKDASIVGEWISNPTGFSEKKKLAEIIQKAGYGYTLDLEREFLSLGRTILDKLKKALNELFLADMPINFNSKSQDNDLPTIARFMLSFKSDSVLTFAKSDGEQIRYDYQNPNSDWPDMVFFLEPTRPCMVLTAFNDKKYPIRPGIDDIEAPGRNTKGAHDRLMLRLKKTER